MLSWSVRLAFLLKLAALSLAIILIGNGPAAAACGGSNQDACPALKRGPQCNPGLEKYKGVCRNWGKEDKKAWPAKRIGFRCNTASLAPNSSGYCKPCGHADGQPACEKLRSGPQCYRYMENINGVCRARGGNGQQPYTGAGFDCKPGYNVGDAGTCQPCGGNGQIECEAMRPGSQCDDGLDSYKNICGAWGAEGQTPWPAARVGFRCEKGLAPSGSGDSETCQPCGKADQPSCEPLRPGKRCDDAYTQENDDGICEKRGGNGQPAFEGIGFECREGFNWDRGLPGNRTCEPCGGFGQVTCEVARPGSICDEGLEQDHDWSLDRNRCYPSLMSKTTDAAWDKIDDVGEDLMGLLGDAFSIHDDSGLTQSLANQDDAAADALSASTDNGVNPCLLDAFKAFSVGATAEANFIIGLGIEGGIAWDVTPEPRNPWKWYGAVSQSTQLGAGTSYGANLGCWTSENTELSGQSVGLVIDLRDFISKTHGLETDILTDVAGGRTATVLVGIWFERDGDRLGDFAGITLSPVLGNGLNLLGATYVESTTGQFGAAAPDGTMRISTLETGEIGNGESMNYCKGNCRIFAGATPTPPSNQPLPVTFSPASAQSASASAVRSTRAVQNVPPPAQDGNTDLMVQGAWSYDLAGRAMVERVTAQDGNSITIQSSGTASGIVYNRVGPDTYKNAAGRTFRFVSADRGIWFTADRQRSYQITRRVE